MQPEYRPMRPIALDAALTGRRLRPSRKLLQRLIDRRQELSGSAAGGMFALEREPAALHQRYGRQRFGQSLLLARRLVERALGNMASALAKA